MGLDVSHGAFSASYSAFNRFRQAVAKAAGGSFPPHEDKSLDDAQWYREPKDIPCEHHDGLACFLGHSDCDGEIAPDMCAKVASALEFLLSKISSQGTGGGHLERDGGLGAVAERFIAGCRLAHESGEAIDFH